ncbi:hypothetical protein B4135_2089 [Caldibacillus debilis]|uniref:Uncharacterized protein n=1 Tax=Caldibacillus debilis TaxID=301148 RepID=A0A150M4A0_9BACI|nr:hypothetical protein B4135_2089 [Caldibacillus debilis]
MALAIQKDDGFLPLIQIDHLRFLTIRHVKNHPASGIGGRGQIASE